MLFHHESVTRIAKAQLQYPKSDQKLRADWGHLLRTRDPCYRPVLELSGRDHRIRVEPCGPAAAHLVPVVLGGHQRRPLHVRAKVPKVEETITGTPQIRRPWPSEHVRGVPKS